MHTMQLHKFTKCEFEGLECKQMIVLVDGG